MILPFWDQEKMQHYISSGLLPCSSVCGGVTKLEKLISLVISFYAVDGVILLTFSTSCAGFGIF